MTTREIAHDELDIDVMIELYEDGATTHCELCGEPLDGRGNGTAEMYDPSALSSNGCLEDSESVVCHADCGLARGMEVA